MGPRFYSSSLTQVPHTDMPISLYKHTAFCPFLRLRRPSLAPTINKPIRSCVYGQTYCTSILQQTGLLVPLAPPCLVHRRVSCFTYIRALHVARAFGRIVRVHCCCRHSVDVSRSFHTHIPASTHQFAIPKSERKNA